MNFTETIGDLRRRQIAGDIRKPLRTFAEMAAELGVPERTVSGKLRRKDAPKPKVKHRSTGGGQRSYYDQAEFRAWWESIQ
jgi:hypothetical protein